MTVVKKKEGVTLTIAPAGRLDTLTAPDLEKELSELPEGTESLVFDLKDLEYISSAGLRVLLFAKNMIGDGKMTVKNANETVNEIFEITGFSDILTVE